MKKLNKFPLILSLAVAAHGGCIGVANASGNVSAATRSATALEALLNPAVGESAVAVLNRSAKTSSGIFTETRQAMQTAGKVMPAGELNAQKLGQVIEALSSSTNPAAKEVAASLTSLVQKIATDVAAENGKPLSTARIDALAGSTMGELVSLNTSTEKTAVAETKISSAEAAALMATVRKDCGGTQEGYCSNPNIKAIRSVLASAPTVSSIFGPDVACLKDNPATEENEGFGPASRNSAQIAWTGVSAAEGKSGEPARVAVFNALKAAMAATYKAMSELEIMKRLGAGLYTGNCRVLQAPAGISFPDADDMQTAAYAQ